MIQKHAKLIFLMLIFSYELYYFNFVPYVLNIKMYVKIAVLLSTLPFALSIFMKPQYRIMPVNAIGLFLYILTVAISCIISVIPLYSAIQCAFLVMVIVFVFSEARVIVHERDISFLRPVLWFMASVVVGSLLLYIAVPAYAGAIESGRFRVHGVYGEPSHLAILCGLTAGLSFILVKHKSLKFGLVILSVILMLLSGSRTPVVALLIAIILFSLTLRIKVVAKVSLVVFYIIALAGLFFVKDRLLNADYVRTNTLLTLSGRTELWSSAMNSAFEHPFGVGFCLGGSILMKTGGHLPGSFPNDSKEKNSQLYSYSAERGYKASLHSGYFQAIADLGMAGCAIYTFLILSSVVMTIILRNVELIKPFSFVCLYLSLCNLTEAVIMSPTSTYTVLFWLSWLVLSMTWKQRKRYRSMIRASAKPLYFTRKSSQPV